MNNVVYPDIWGQGTIFAYSGLDGENTFDNSLVGYLSGDGIGINFHTPCQSTLRFILDGIFDVRHKIVTSDMIQTYLKGEKEHFLEIIFVAQNTILMRYTDAVKPQLIFGKDFSLKIEGDIRIYTSEGETFALLEKKDNVVSTAVLSYGENAKDDASSFITIDADTEIVKKLEYYNNLPQAKSLDQTYQKLLNKCFSVMKTMVYTPCGMFKTRWTTPDRLPHKRLWLWDSVFHSVGFKYIDKSLAKDALLAVFATQQEDGMIPHMSSPYEVSKITQPPVLAWGVYELYKYTKDKSLLAETYDKLKKFLDWIMENRDADKNFLYEWHVNNTSVVCRCDECGMDNSPRFDNVTVMDSIDFSCFMAKEVCSMERISEILNNGEASYWNDIFNKIKNAINENLYDKEDGFYYDRIHSTGELKKVKAVSSFLPLFAEVCDKEQAESLITHICNKSEFATDMPLPSITPDNESYSGDMWRGPVWINYNYMIAKGLENYGYTEKAKEIKKATLSGVLKWYLNNGVLFEYYDPENNLSPARLERKGPNITPYMPMVKMQAIRDFGWSCALSAAMLLELNHNYRLSR